MDDEHAQDFKTGGEDCNPEFSRLCCKTKPRDEVKRKS